MKTTLIILNNFTTIIAEPITADCIYKSGTSDTGDAISVGGDLKTIMAGLACGVPNPVTWQILRDCSNYLAAVDDSVTATGMRVLGNPIANDTRVISGGSGAVTLGLLYRLCAGSYSGASDNADDVDNGIDAVGYSDIEFCSDANGSVSADISIREQLGLNQDSVIMIFSTEGDTNPDLYRDVVWDGFLSLTDKQRQ